MTKKEIAQHFLTLCAKGESRQAFQLYVSEHFRHHNIHFKGDGQSLMVAMEENAKKFPDKQFEILRSLEDENLVAVHSRVKITSNDQDVAVIHIFCFEQNRIIELWDIGQAVPKEMMNENGMF